MAAVSAEGARITVCCGGTKFKPHYTTLVATQKIKLPNLFPKSTENPEMLPETLCLLSDIICLKNQFLLLNKNCKVKK